uniref:DNA 3'-5' helicase n=1 Tax=Kalmanozyma brasiliensis TaxID=1392244 RepID=A0AA48SEY8_9BASI|nr:TPA_inf: MER3 [Kalmanozyma brasiliensis]
MTEELDFASLAQHYGHDADNRSGDQFSDYRGEEGLMPDDPYHPSDYYPATMPPLSNPNPFLQGSYYQQGPPSDHYEAAALSRHFDFDRAQVEGLVAQPSPSSSATINHYPPSPYAFDHRSQMNADNRGQMTTHYLGQFLESAGVRSQGNESKIIPLPPQPQERSNHEPVRPSENQRGVWAEPEPGRKVQLVLESTENIVLSAPTGSGKTVVFELALLRMLTKDPENARAVYLAPTKALCAERTRDWSARFGPVGCGVTELTGDSVHGLHVARKSRLVITTPEKWDSLTRKWDEQSGILSTVRLVLIDEVHILNEAQRGARLEVVVTRTKNRGNQVRFVAVSATVPNLEDVARWIGPNLYTQRQGESGPTKTTAEIFQFDDKYRPCPLQKHVYGYAKNKDEFAFQAYLNCKLFELVETHAAGRPCLIFCATRRSTVQAAKAVVEARKQANEDADGPSLPIGDEGGPSSQAQLSFDDEDLRTLASSGVAFHHAGLTASDRRTVEQAFLADRVAVLCCTTTLATGVNLPAYCVIIRGTRQYDGHWIEMSELDMIQMMGRAGRPQFDRSGVAVIMCEDTMQGHYRELVSGSRGIESSLAPCLVEHVNAEIGLRGRTTESQIEDWIRQSFMWTRLHKNPTYYLSREEGIGLDSVEDILKHLVTQTLTALQEASLIARSEDSVEISSTEYGIIMSRFFLRHKTMLALIAMPLSAHTREILEAICEADEFGEQRMRQGEKGFLNDLRTHPEIRFPPRQVSRVADKVSLLIQAHLSAINLSHVAKSGMGEASPYMDIKRIFPHATRIAKAVVDVTIYRCDGVACKAALDLARSIAAGAWEGSPAMLRQFDQIGERSIKALANAGIVTWQKLSETTSTKIEMILNRHPPFGSKVIAAAQSVPRIGLEVMQRSAEPSKATSFTLPANRAGTSLDPADLAPFGMKVVLEVKIWVENRATCMLKSKTSRMPLSICVLMLRSDGGYVDFRRMPIWRFDSEKRFTVHVHLDNPRMRVVTTAACDEIAGTLVQASLLPVDVASGSHRIRIARAEIQNGSPNDFDALAEDEYRAGPSRSFADSEAARASRGAELPDEHDADEESSWKKCKHKCKSECGHPCCQRSKEVEASGKLPKYRFQSRLPDQSSQSTVPRYLKPASTPSGSSTAITQKRKAELEPALAYDLEAPQDLLSRLDRQEAEYDRMHGTTQPLQMPGRRGEDRRMADDVDGDASANGLSPSKRRLTTELPGRDGRSWHEEGAPRVSQLRSTDRELDASEALLLLDEHDQTARAPPASTPSGPAQRRFLAGIGPSPFGDRTDPND